MRDFRVHCSHAVDRVDRTDRDRLTVHAKIPVNADRLHRQEDGEVLPRKGHEAAAGRGLDLFLDDGGRASDEGHPIRRHFSDHPDRESWPGKRLALRDPHPERPGDCPDLVLVEVAQRFDELQLHVLREPADIVVGLDPIPELAPALDPVRGDRPLDQVVGPEGLRLSLEKLDELATDDGPFLLRVDDAPQGREEFVRGVDDPVPHAEFLQRLRDVLGLSFPHEPGVDVDREKAISEGATREDRRRGAVDPTRTGDDRLARDGLADGLGLFGDESGRVEHHSPSVRESSSTHFFNASRCSLSLSTSRSSRNAKISTARMAAFSPRSRPTAATGTPGGICETLRTASRFSLPLTGTPITGFVVWAAIVPRSAANSLALHDCQEEEPNRRGGSDDGREDHANRLDDDVDQVYARAKWTRVPRPQRPDDQAAHEQSNPDLPALPASEVRGEGSGDDQEETEGQEEDGQKRQPVKRGKGAHVIPQNLMPVKVFVSMTPGIDRILSTTT